MREDQGSPPTAYFFLVAPYGICAGFASVTLPFVLTKAGWSVSATAVLVAVAVSSNLWRFAWSPLADLTFSTRTWYLFGLIAAACSLLAFGFVPLEEGPLLTGLVFVSQVAGTLVVLPVGGMIAHSVAEHAKGRASGLYQAGSLAGVGIGGGAGVWLFSHVSLAAACYALAAGVIACGTALMWVPNVHALKSERVSGRLREMGSDFLALIKSTRALYVMVLVASPIGVGAASGLWSAAAGDWHAPPDTVAIATGAFAGIVSAVGSVVGGWLCDRVGRFRVFFGSSALLAAFAAVFALMPFTPRAYSVGVLMYALLMGAPYGAYSALIFYAIGKGAASGKYAIVASLGNLPVVYMTAWDGWAHDRWGAAGMLYLEAVITVVSIGIALLGLVWAIRRPKSDLALSVTVSAAVAPSPEG